MSTSFPITREQFAAWLDSKDDNDVVGRTCCYACPIAAAVQELTHQSIVVNTSYWSVDRRVNAGATPTWVSAFIDDLDFGTRLPMNAPVTAAAARRVLSKAVQS